MFNRILKLFPKFGNTPLENFTTEVLVGVLETDQTLLDKFVNVVLKIEGKNFKIRPQASHKLDTTTKYIDIEIQNDDCICFLENKVNALENENQLKNYAEILKKIGGTKKKYLRYCTRYIEGEYQFESFENFEPFKHFRWNDIYDFLKDYTANALVNNFRNFLNKNNMGTDLEFSVEDFKNLSALKGLLPKLQEYKIIFKEAFKNEISEKFNEPDVFKRILNYGDLIVQKEYKKGLWVGAGLSFNGKPRLTVWIWIHKNTNDKGLIINLLKNEFDENSPKIEIHENGLEIFSLIADDEQNIEAWYTTNLKKVKNFIVNTNEKLSWQD